MAKKFMKRPFAPLLLALIVHSAASAQVPYTGGVYTETFDIMGTADPAMTPSGWFVGAAAGGNGTISGTTVATRDGNTTTTRNGNYGSAGSTDRALGSKAGSAAGGDLNMEVQIQNLTGAPITSFRVRYDGEQWADAGATEKPQTLVLKYSTDGTTFVDLGPAFDFSSPVNAVAAGGANNPLDGNLAANRVANLGGDYTPETPVPDGGVIYLRWFDRNNSGADHILAIDNFSFGAPSPVVIVTQPEDQTALEGETVRFKVEATGFFPSYQWHRVGAGPISGETNATLIIPRITVTGAGDYFVVVSNELPSMETSRAARLNVIEDVTPPQLVCAIGYTNLTNILVTFSEPIKTNDLSQVPTQWDVLSVPAGTEVAILGAEALSETNILLTTAPRAAFTGYKLIINGVEDIHDVPIAPNSEVPLAQFEVSLLVVDDTHFWRYEQSGTDLGVEWVSPDYPDLFWSEGLAAFDAKRDPDTPSGYAERTMLNGETIRTFLTLSNALGDAQIPTIYFRTRFELSAPVPDAVLRFRPFVDDGAVYYINGVEVLRYRMPEGTILYDTLANSPAIGNAAYDGPFDVCVTNLIEGENFLAVEVHQQSLGSSDLTMGLSLSHVSPEPPPRVRIAYNASTDMFEISWTGNGVLQYTEELKTPPQDTVWFNVANFSPYLEPAFSPRRFYRLEITP
jgi:hypothetical protein